MFGFQIHNILDKVPQLLPHFRGIVSADRLKQLSIPGDFLIVNTEYVRLLVF